MTRPAAGQTVRERPLSACGAASMTPRSGRSVPLAAARDWKTPPVYISKQDVDRSCVALPAPARSTPPAACSACIEMGVLTNLEARLEGLVEGVFNRAFRARVQPVELARKLAKEMDSYKTVSVSRTYVPNEYIVFLSREDRRQFEGYEPALLDELSAAPARARRAARTSRC